MFINLKCVMHQSEKYGYLLINGSIPSLSQVSSLIHTHHKTLDKRLLELVSNGVIKQDKDGVYYCPQMVQNEELRQARREAGRLGGIARQRDLLKQKSSTSQDFAKDQDESKDLPKLLGDIERACDYLCENEIFPEAHAWKDEMLEQGKSKRAILHTLMRCATDKFEVPVREFCAGVMESAVK